MLDEELTVDETLADLLRNELTRGGRVHVALGRHGWAAERCSVGGSVLVLIRDGDLNDQGRSASISRPRQPGQARGT